MIRQRLTPLLVSASFGLVLGAACTPAVSPPDDGGAVDAGDVDDDAGVLPADGGAPDDDGGTPDDAGVTTPPDPGERDGTPSELAAIITSGDEGTAEVVAATRHVLARAGVATVDDGAYRVAAFPPLASATVTSLESFKLALEARNRSFSGRVTASQVAQMLADFGWPFSGDSAPAQQLMTLLSLWVTDARAAPDDEDNFIPLFLAEMAARQVPVVDLGSGEASPDVVRFTLLELEVLAAAFDRATTSTAPAGTMGALSTSPCSDFKKQLGSLGEVVGVGASELVGAGLGAGLEAAGLSPADAEAFGKGMTALGIAMKIWKLMALYHSAEVAVSVDSENPLHKPEAGESLLSSFTARAGVRQADWDAYQAQRTEAVESANRAVRDCLNSVGLPTMADLGEIAGDAASWRVRWRLLEGSPEHAFISLENNEFYLPGQLAMQLSQQGAFDAAATLAVDITPELATGHRGYEREAAVTARAEVDTTQPPSLGTLVNAMKGGLGLADSLVELGAGWYQEMAPPKSYATLTVRYHEQPTYRLFIEESYTVVGDGGTATFHAVYTGDIAARECGDGSSAEAVACYDGTIDAVATQGIQSTCDITWSQDFELLFRDEVHAAATGEVLRHLLPIRTAASAVTTESGCPEDPGNGGLPVFGTWDTVPDFPLPQAQGQKTTTTFRAMGDVVQVTVEIEAL